MPGRYLADLEHAARALKQGMERRDATSLALACAHGDAERRAAMARHEAACLALEALKRAFLDAARAQSTAPAPLPSQPDCLH